MNGLGFPNMMGGGPMGMAQQQQPNQQMVQQVQQELIRTYTNQQAQMQMGDWRRSVAPKERAGYVMELSTCMMLAKPNLQQRESLNHCVRIETSCLTQAPDKNQYAARVRRVLQDLTEARSRNAQQNLNAMQMRAMQQPGGMMPQNPMQGNPNNQNNAQNPLFPPQLQQQMQASPLPTTNPQNLMQMSNSTMGGNPQMPAQANQPAQQPGPPGAQQQPPTFTASDNAAINALAQKLAQNATPEKINSIQMSFQKLTPQQQEAVRQKWTSPVLLHFRQEAQRMWMTQKRQQMQAQMGNQRPNMGVNPAMMQNNLQRNGQQAGAQSMAGSMGGQGFDISQIVGQQADAMRSQDAGQVVVPASNNLNINQQVSGMPMGVNQPGLGQQGMGGGQMQNGVQRQNFLNPQQAQQASQNQMNQMRLRMAQAQAQAQAQQNLQRQQTQQRNMNNQMGGMVGQQPQPNPMSLLTQPLAQGQPGGNTPQPRPQSTMPQIPQQPNQMDPKALHALQQAQQRVSSLGGPGQQFQGARRQLPPFIEAMGLPDHYKEKLATMPDEAYQAALHNLRTRAISGNFPGGQMPNLQRSQVQTPQPQNLSQGPNPLMGMGNQQPGQMNQPQMPGNAINEQAQLQRLNAQLAANLNIPPQLLQRLDQQPFTPTILTANQEKNVPEHIKTWGQLKQWSLQNRNIAVLQIDKVLQLQFAHILKQKQAQRANQAPNGTGMPQPNLAAPSMPGQGMPNFQPQQQIPPTAMPQTWEVIPVTPEELMHFRQRQPRAQGMPDEQVRQLIQKRKFDMLQKQRLAQQQPQQQFLQNSIQQPMPIQQQMAQSRPMGQVTQQRPPSQQPQQKQMPPMPTPQATPRQPTATTQIQQGIKRPAPDDVTETASPALAAPAQVNMSHRPPTQNQQQQPAQQNGATKAQKASVPQDPMERKWNELVHKYNNHSIPRRRSGPIPPEQRRHLETLLKETAAFIPQLDDCIKTFLINTGNEEQTAQYIKMRMVLRDNVDFQTFALAEDLTQEPKVVENMIIQVRKLVAAVTMQYKKQNLRGHSTTSQDSTQSQAQRAGAVPRSIEVFFPPQQTSAAPAQLNAANLQQHNQSTQRRQSNKPPPAPTAEPGQNPLWTSSPQGVPRYEAPPKLTTADLKPPPKKRKTAPTATPTAPAQTTPASTASPQVKGTSPEVPRKQVEAPMEPPKPVIQFKCPENGCDKVFQTQDQLDAHKKEAHVVIKDFVAYVLESLAGATGLNSDGTPKAPEKAGSLKPATASTAEKKDAQKSTEGKATSGKPDKTTDASVDPNDLWANAPMKQNEIADIFLPVDEFAKTDAILDNFSPTREQLIALGVIFPSRPITPEPEEVPDLSDPNTTPSPPDAEVPDIEKPMPKWLWEPWEWRGTKRAAPLWDGETVFDDTLEGYVDPDEDPAERAAWKAAQEEREREAKRRKVSYVEADREYRKRCRESGYWGTGPMRDGGREEVVPLTEKQVRMREERRREAEEKRRWVGEEAVKNEERLKKWKEMRVEEEEKFRKKTEEIERLKYLKQSEVPGWG